MAPNLIAEVRLSPLMKNLETGTRFSDLLRLSGVYDGVHPAAAIACYFIVAIDTLRRFEPELGEQ